MLLPSLFLLLRLCIYKTIPHRIARPECPSCATIVYDLHSTLKGSISQLIKSSVDILGVLRVIKINLGIMSVIKIFGFYTSHLP